MARCLLPFYLLITFLHASSDLTQLLPRNCHHHKLPDNLNGLGGLGEDGKLISSGVYGVTTELASTLFTIPAELTNQYFIALSIETEKDSPLLIKSVEVIGRQLSSNYLNSTSDVFSNNEKTLKGRVVTGSAGPNSRVTLTDSLFGNGSSGSLYEIRYIFKRKKEDTNCTPVHLDIALLPAEDVLKHIPVNCPVESTHPPQYNTPLTLTEAGLSHDEPNTYVHAHGLHDWEVFEDEIWSIVVDVPHFLAHNVHFEFSLNHLFVSGPFQLIIEQYPLISSNDKLGMPSHWRLNSKQVNGHEVPRHGGLFESPCSSPSQFCLTGTPVDNGQIIDHTLPSGFRYKVAIMAGESVYTDLSETHCMEYNLSYNVKYIKSNDLDVAMYSVCKEAILPNVLRQKSDHFHTGLRRLNDNYLFNNGTEVTIEITESYSLLRLHVVHQSRRIYLRIVRHQSTQPVCDPLYEETTSGFNSSIACLLPVGTYHLTLTSETTALLPQCDNVHMTLLLVTENNLKERSQCTNNQSAPFRIDEIRYGDTPDWRESSISLPGYGENSNSVIFSKTISTPKMNVYVHSEIISDLSVAGLSLVVRDESKKKVFDRVTEWTVKDHVVLNRIGPLEPHRTYTLDFVAFFPQHASPGQFPSQRCTDIFYDIRMLELHTVNQCGLPVASLPPRVVIPSDTFILIDEVYSSSYVELDIEATEPTVLRVESETIEHAPSFLLHGTHNFERRKADIQVLIAHPQSILLESNKGHVHVDLESPRKYTLRINAGYMKAFDCRKLRVFITAESKSLLDVCDATREPNDGFERFLNQNPDLFNPSDPLAIRTPHLLTITPELDTSVGINFQSSKNSLRINFELEHPWIPLKVTLTPENDKLDIPIVSSDRIASRVILLAHNVPGGRYHLRFHTSDILNTQSRHFCSKALLDISVISQSTTENASPPKLHIASLLPAQNFPKTMNRVGWVDHKASFYQRGKFRFSGLVESNLYVRSDVFLRIASEPTDIYGNALSIKITSLGSNEWMDKSGNGTFFLPGPASYTVSFVGNGSYLLTIASEEKSFIVSRFRKMNAYQCPAINNALIDNLEQVKDSMFESEIKHLAVPRDKPNFISVHLNEPSLVEVEAGSDFLLSPVVISIEVDTIGVFESTQEGKMSELRIQLPAGNYKIIVKSGEPLPSSYSFRGIVQHNENQDLVDHCMKVSLRLRVTANDRIAQDKKSSTDPISTTTTAMTCQEPGAQAPPLSFMEQGGGSVFGGPPDKDGRLLVRTRLVIHDSSPVHEILLPPIPNNHDSIVLKIGVFVEDDSNDDKIESSVIHGNTVLKHHAQWILSQQSYETVYILKPMGQANITIALKPSGETHNCIVFDFNLQMTPLSDVPKMMSCTGGGYLSPPDVFKNKSSDLNFLSHEPSGFLAVVPITITVPTFFSADINHNFLLSHVETDIISSENETSSAVGQIDFFNDAKSPLNVRQSMMSVLAPGNYRFRIASDSWTVPADDYDDPHIKRHTNACTPFSHDVKLVPLSDKAVILNVSPDPSYIHQYGSDFLLLISMKPNIRESGELDLRLTGNGVSLEPHAVHRVPEGDVTVLGVIWNFKQIQSHFSFSDPIAEFRVVPGPSFVSEVDGSEYTNLTDKSLVYKFYTSPSVLPDRIPWYGLNFKHAAIAPSVNYAEEEKMNVVSSMYAPVNKVQMSNQAQEEKVEELPSKLMPEENMHHKFSPPCADGTYSCLQPVTKTTIYYQLGVAVLVLVVIVGLCFRKRILFSRKRKKSKDEMDENEGVPLGRFQPDFFDLE